MELPRLDPPSESRPLWVKAHQLWQKNERYLAAEFFLAGFIFDIATLSRIDEWLTILQQGVFIFLALALLCIKTLNWEMPSTWPRLFHRAWGYQIEALHFIFGSLLSAFTLFYFKSSSIFVSFAFLLILLALLVANELQRFQRLELPFKWGLFVLCLVSFTSYVVPILLGFIGVTTFLISVALTIGVVGLTFRWLVRRTPDPAMVKLLRKNVLLPTAAVTAFFVAAYLLNLVPPVPLSLKFVGIYHQVSRTGDGTYELQHENPWWRFWHTGDQDFRSLPGDKIYCYFRLFSPGGFKDEIRLHWLLKEPRSGWTTQDKIPLKVLGGRDEGYRGFGAKANFSPGQWRVQVETTEGREIGRIYFTVSPNTEVTEPLDRQFELEIQ